MAASNVHARTLEIVRDGGESELRVDGAFDVLTVGEINSAIESVVSEHPRRVTIDLEHVSLLDSAGVSAIVALWRRVRAEGGSVAVVHAHDQPLTVVKLLKLDALLATGRSANENAR